MKVKLLKRLRNRIVTLKIDEIDYTIVMCTNMFGRVFDHIFCKTKEDVITAEHKMIKRLIKDKRKILIWK